MLGADCPEGLAGYAAVTGRHPDRVALEFFRLTWDLADLAAFAHVLRSPHEHSADTAKAYEGLTACAAIRDEWAKLLG
jgi:hypothetical protein